MVAASRVLSSHSDGIADISGRQLPAISWDQFAPQELKLPMSANGMVRPCSAPPAIEAGKGRQRQGARHVPEFNKMIAVIGIDIGKNSFHAVGHDERGAIALRQKWSRGQVEARLANMPPCLIGMEACVGAHHLSRKLKALGHDARLMPAKYVRP